MTEGVATLPRRFASLVKLEHTLFALPFAYVGAFLAVDGVPSGHDLLWITVAMVGARSLAMGLNRLIDAEIDARNPRTAGRELPSGALGRGQVVAFCLASLAVFLVGVVDGLAPVGAWVAITGEFPLEAWLLGAAVACWIAGFDCFYALLDLDVDREQGLHSVATRFGERGAFAAARLLHAATVVLLAAVGLGLAVGPLYWFGVGVVAVLLVYEHSLVRPGDLRRLDLAFFTMNGTISVVFCGFVLADAVL